MPEILKNSLRGLILVTAFFLVVMGISAFALNDYLRKLNVTLNDAEYRITIAEARLERQSAIVSKRGNAPRQFPVSRCLTAAIGQVPTNRRNSDAFGELEILCAIIIYPDARDELIKDAAFAEQLVNTHPKIIKSINDLKKETE